MSIFLMGTGEWGMGNGDWRLGTGEWGVGIREWGVGSRKRTADVGTSCPLTAYRFPNLLTIFFK